jgi:hypothetical protein
VGSLPDVLSLEEGRHGSQGKELSWPTGGERGGDQ